VNIADVVAQLQEKSFGIYDFGLEVVAGEGVRAMRKKLKSEGEFPGSCEKCAIDSP
jgi:hypothetical protein